MSASGSPKKSPIPPETRLRELGIQLPPAPTPFGAYVPAVQAGNLLFLSGMLPTHGHEPRVLGRLGQDVDVDSARNAARIAALNAVALARQHLARIIHQACEGSERGAARSARRRESQIGGGRVNFLAVTGLDGGSETTVGANTGRGSACSPCSASEQERSPSCSGQVTPAPAVHRARERKSAAQGKARGSCTTIRRTDWRTRAATLSRRRRMVSNCCAPSSRRSA